MFIYLLNGKHLVAHIISFFLFVLTAPCLVQHNNGMNLSCEMRSFSCMMSTIKLLRLMFFTWKWSFGEWKRRPMKVRVHLLENEMKSNDKKNKKKCRKLRFLSCDSVFYPINEAKEETTKMLITWSFDFFMQNLFFSVHFL